MPSHVKEVLSMLYGRSWRPGVRFGRRTASRYLWAAVLVAVVFSVAATAGVWSDDFEQGDGWTASGLWHVTETDSHSPTHSYWFGQEASGDYDTGGRVQGRLTSPVLEVNGPGSVQLDFWYRRDVEWRFFQYSVRTDVTTVYVRFDGGSWRQLWKRDSSNLSLDVWRHAGSIWINVPSGADEMQISFRFDSVNAGSNGHKGWFVDDVTLDGNPIESQAPSPDVVSDPEIVLPDGTDLDARDPGPCTTTVTYTSETPGVTVHYTLDGTDPTEASPVFPPAGLDLEVPCGEERTLKLRAYKEGMTPSNVVEETFGCTCDGVIPPPPADGDLVRFVYLIPEIPGVVEGITRAVEDLRLWFFDALGGWTFLVHDPLIEVFGTPHPADWYATSPNGDAGLRFVNNAAEDGFAVTGGMFDDPDYLWVYIIDAEPDCGQEWYLGERRVVVMPRHALDGLVGDAVPEPPCPADGDRGSGEWIGLLAKLMGFALGLTEPPACVAGGPAPLGCVGCDEEPIFGCPDGALMWTGYLDYPNAFFLAAEEDALRANPLFAETDPLADCWYETFEDADGWTTSGLWHLTDDTYHSPTHAYWFADPVTLNYGSGASSAALDRGSRTGLAPRALLQPVSGILTSPTIAVAGGTQVMLSFWYWREVEYFVGDEFDVTTVEVAYDRGPFEEVWRKDSTFVSRRAWVLSGVLLDVPAGTSALTLRFVFDTIDAYANRFRGWIIDDVRLCPVVDGGVAPTALGPSIATGRVEDAPIQVACIPSPVRDVHTARFTVLGEEVEGLIVQIFDLSGVLVWEKETDGSELIWHTESSSGDFVANGVYIYRSLVKVDGAWIDAGVSKLTILR
jgi:hypothetical protein